MESSAILGLAAQATTAAHIMGLYRDPGDWNIPPWEKIRRKRLWWATFVADVWSAQAFDTPYHIHADMYSTLPVGIEELLLDEDVHTDLQHLIAPEDASPRLEPAARFVATVNLAHISRDVLHITLQRGLPACPTVEEMRQHLSKARQRLKKWRQLLPSCLDCIGPNTETYGNNAPMLLTFHATHALLLRGLMAPATAAAKADANSSIRQWTPMALRYSQSLNDFMSRIGVNELDGFWGRYARSQLTLCGNFLIYLFLPAFEPNGVSAAFALLESFHDSLQKLNEMTDSNSRLLIRPVALRIDSFFIFASQLAQQCSS